jgi:uncharacterized membrane protein
MHSTILIFKFLSLCIIIGATITVGAVVAPIVFGMLARAEAGEIMIKVFKRYDSWLLISVIILLVCSLLQYFFQLQAASFNVAALPLNQHFQLLVTLIITAISFYLTLKLAGDLLSVRESDPILFREIHLLSEKLHKANFFLGILLIILTIIGL